MKIALVATLLFFTAMSASATPINASVGCAANTCIITPDGGNVALDNNSFALEIDWSPQHIELTEPADDRGEWLVAMFFELTGTVTAANSFETVPATALDLTDMDGVAIASINPQYDDVNLDNGTLVLRINFEIFGPDALGSFLAHGMTLAASSFVPLNGATIDSFEFRDARLSASQGTAVDGIWVAAVPEPGTLALLGIGLLGMGLTRKRTA